jgi:CO/xanthine dehydrogenase Mo-binding subunit
MLSTVRNVPYFEDFSGFRGFTHSYIVISTALDVPPIQAIFFAHAYAGAPHGAKRLGEMPCAGPASAVVNVLAHAPGVHVTHIPVTPEDFLAAWRDTRACLPSL